MNEIIGDDYPTYEDSVNATLAEKQKEDAYTYLTEVEHKIHKENLERVMRENLELRHRLSCIADDIEIIAFHIENTCNKKFKKPSRMKGNCIKYKDNAVHADQAWHNISNIEIACDLNDDSCLEWSSDELDNLNKDLDDDPVFQGHLKHMESVDEYSSKYKAIK